MAALRIIEPAIEMNVPNQSRRKLRCWSATSVEDSGAKQGSTL
jgi:hypothetical protein